MSFCCPVCNGFRELMSSCPSCGNLIQDRGRFADDLGPYSPYESIDLMAVSNGFTNDLAQHICIHTTFCPLCQHTFSIGITEIIL